MFDLDEVLLKPKEFYPDVLAKKHKFISSDLAWSKEFFDVLEGKRNLTDVLSNFEPLSHLSIEEINDIVHNQWPQSEGIVDHKVLIHALKLKALGLKIVAATNNPPEKCRFIQEELLPGLFDAFLASWELKTMKDNPRFFKDGLEVLQNVPGLEDLSFKEIVFFDDNLEYVKSAASVGINARLYGRSQQVQELVDEHKFNLFMDRIR